ncbi:DNA adenine methylase [uncultured Bacteroides sp.]|uniref:DNA adenine methylase n=1 Tax=uncultured Bacteroides sp. TaxID=162156 RepID=UPI0026096CBE|nr:DNA adenine methylase [uncultured Bacteroides sp.]
MGSKRRIWKYISPIILEGRTQDQYYVEPFCGGCNSIAQVEGNRIAADINPYLIGMWKGLQGDEIYPVEISRETYMKAQKAYRNKEYTNYSVSEIGWIGYMSSYNGMFYRSYSGIGSDGRDYIKASMNNILKQLPLLDGVIFNCCPYDKLEIPENSIIYCDPPYKGTKGYDIEFDHDMFYDWCFKKNDEGHRIYISEYSMPPEFKCIWSMDISNSLDRYSKHKDNRKECLFTI